MILLAIPVIKGISLAHCGLCDPREVQERRVCAHTKSQPPIAVCFDCAAQLMSAIQAQAFRFEQ